MSSVCFPPSVDRLSKRFDLLILLFSTLMAAMFLMQTARINFLSWYQNKFSLFLFRNTAKVKMTQQEVQHLVFFFVFLDENKRNWNNLEEQIRNAGTGKDSKLITQNENSHISISSSSLSQKLVYLCNCSNMQVWFWGLGRGGKAVDLSSRSTYLYHSFNPSPPSLPDAALTLFSFASIFLPLSCHPTEPVFILIPPFSVALLYFEDL